ncbi:uncharacterized protein PAC_12781 [Phialocephala subalpina]|uniref:Uncharacterized protein n=1 Tax=Phialocephala subalpina TaxID=576137 RepID=A0A1L7XCX8_9HELO|nr:uncharacterized protein PAC_12781 [Phialocephala subalpina]
MKFSILLACVPLLSLALALPNAGALAQRDIKSIRKRDMVTEPVEKRDIKSIRRDMESIHKREPEPNAERYIESIRKRDIESICKKRDFERSDESL